MSDDDLDADQEHRFLEWLIRAEYAQQRNTFVQSVPVRFADLAGVRWDKSLAGAAAKLRLEVRLLQLTLMDWSQAWRRSKIKSLTQP